MKKRNRKTYPLLLHSMLTLPGEVSRPPLFLAAKQIEAGKSRICGDGLHIGLNTGGSGRWDLKKLSEAKTCALALDLQKIPNAYIWLLSGPAEFERNERIANEAKVARVPSI